MHTRIHICLQLVSMMFFAFPANVPFPLRDKLAAREEKKNKDSDTKNSGVLMKLLRRKSQSSTLDDMQSHDDEVQEKATFFG